MSRVKYLSFFLILLSLISSCTHRSKSKKLASPVQISENVQKNVDESRALLQAGKNKDALQLLTSLKDDQLSQIEKAVKYNLKGVILFHDGNIDKSLANFDIAKKYVPKSTTIESQVYLNLSSIYFKQGLFTELRKSLDKVEPDFLSKNEQKKYSQLDLAWSIKFEQNFKIVQSIINLSEDLSLTELNQSTLKEKAIITSKSLSQADVDKIFELEEDSNSFILGYLAQQEAEKQYFNGDKRKSRQLAEWMKDKYQNEKIFYDYAQDLLQRLNFSQSLSMSGVGVILPLSGEKSAYSEKILQGIEAALKKVEIGRPIEIWTKDNMGSQTVALQATRDIILEHKVPIVIGGLFPDTAKAEYLEAKRFGVFFISLAPIHLPSEDKNYLLLEVQPSNESQLNKLFQTDFLDKFGRKVGIIYPDSDVGKIYSEEFWKASIENKIEITAISQFPKNSLDYRDTVQHFLGLKFPRERVEEEYIWRDVYAKEKSSIRRIQFLPPEVNFDWVFLGSLPQESLSLIPTLSYYDAKNLKIFGGPSWSSKQLVQEQKNLGRLYFVGDDPSEIPTDFFEYFTSLYSKRPGFLETISYEAMSVSLSLMSDGSYSRRDDFNESIKNKSKILGLVKDWNLSGGLWIKDLDLLQINQGQIKKVNYQQDDQSSSDI